MTDERITAYLLQELTEEEAERFEEQCFAEEEWPADLDSAEQELIDAYLRNELSKGRRRRFETNYLTTDTRKARVLTAQSFLHVLCPVPQQRETLREKLRALLRHPRILQSAKALFLLATSVLLLLPLLPGGGSPQTVVRLDLAISTSDRASGVQPEKVALPLGADALEIHLKLPEQSPNTVGYRVEWQSFKGSLGTLKIESQDAQSLVVIIPTTRLSEGQYLLKLFKTNRDGTEESLGNSYFTAEEAARTR
jgi:hypothetical protein